MINAIDTYYEKKLFLFCAIFLKIRRNENKNFLYPKRMCKSYFIYKEVTVLKSKQKSVSFNFFLGNGLSQIFIVEPRSKEDFKSIGAFFNIKKDLQIFVFILS